MPRARKAFFASLAGAAAAATGISTLGVAQADTQPNTPPSAAGMPSAVEDFSYPGAAQIQQEYGIVLKRGDGHITYVSCDQPYDIQVKSRTGQRNYCFDVTAKQGYLTLELPDAFGMWTEDHPVKAKITADGHATVVDAPANDYTTFGEAGDAGKRSVLVELRVTG